jgi:hypothetical protein
VTGPVRDPYLHVAELLERQGAPVVTAKQMRDAAVLATAMLAALGYSPAVVGDATHPTVLKGLALLDTLRPQPVRGGDPR